MSKNDNDNQKLIKIKIYENYCDFTKHAGLVFKNHDDLHFDLFSLDFWVTNSFIYVSRLQRMGKVKRVKLESCLRLNHYVIYRHAWSN